MMDELLPEPESMAPKWEAFALQYGPDGVATLTLRQAWKEHREERRHGLLLPDEQRALTDIDPG